MARKHVPLWHALNASLTIHPAKSADLFGVLFATGAAPRPMEPREDQPLAITDLPLFGMLRTRMQWHQERQRVLAQNVANSDTRDFKPRDLAPLQFEQAGSGTASLALRRPEGTRTAYAAGSMSGLQSSQSRSFEARPTGAAVNLEDEMLKVAANQMDFQAASSLYIKSLGLLKIAIGKR
jgi:flagellar basal-body rod protein FlgB